MVTTGLEVRLRPSTHSTFSASSLLVHDADEVDLVNFILTGATSRVSRLAAGGQVLNGAFQYQPALFSVRHGFRASWDL